AALSEANHDFFIVVRPVPSSTFAFSASNVGFVHLDSTVQHGTLSFFHGSTNAMAEIPSGFVANSESSFDLISRHALPRFAQQQRSKEPFGKGQVRIVEDSGSSDGELVIAFLAIEQLLGGRQFDHGTIAAQALRAIGPAQPNQQFAASFIGVEQVYNVN